MYRFLDTPRRRGLQGCITALLFMILMFAVTACLETPIGDPERGWVDPRVTGAWLVGGEDVDAYGGELWLFEPYDSRTWLVTVVRFEDSLADQPVGSQPAMAPAENASPDVDLAQETRPSSPPPAQPEDVLRRVDALAEDRARPAGQLVFKAWLTSIANRRFLVLEPKVLIDTTDGFGPGMWFVYRIVLKGERMELAEIDTDTDRLGTVDTRGEAEQIIARHAADPDFYTDTGILHRVPREAYDPLMGVLKRAGFGFQ
jgi:hypothetical protein